MPNNADEKPGHGSDDKEEVTDVRGGVRFGTGIAYDDAYAGTGGGDDDDYVNSLPTVDEERKLMGDDDDVRTRERAELDDAGRVGGGMQPSTMASTTGRSGEDESAGENYDPFKDADGGNGLVNTRNADRLTNSRNH
jgi:hypothetical protein